MIENLLSSINIHTYFGKVSYDRSEKTISYVIALDNLIPPFDNSLKRILDLTYKCACKFVIEVSNSLLLFNSNPDLRPKEISDLAYKYQVPTAICVQDARRFSQMSTLVDQKFN